jgi:hypothetical protein
MSVEVFLDHADLLLKRSDIVLSRSPTLASKLIRWGTGGFFSHAALVFLVPKPQEGFVSTFVLESISSGVGLANLRDYIDRKHGHSDIVVRRLEALWFTEDRRAELRGLMLERVKARYDYGRVFRLALSSLFGIQLGYERLRTSAVSAMGRTVRRARRRKANWVPPQFICSGFVQYGFAEIARRYKVPEKEISFSGELKLTEEDILAITPEDIAKTARLQWLYAITRGRVYRVTTYEEAKAVISGGKR